MANSSAGEVADELRRLAQQVDELAREMYTQLNTHAGVAPTDEELNAAVSGVVKRFEAMLDPNPEDLAALAEPFKKIAAGLGTERNQHGEDDLGMIDTARNLVGQWDGPLRDNFIGNYLDPLSTTVANQGKVADFLSRTAETMERIHQGRREDAIMVAEETLTVLEGITVAGGPPLAVSLSPAIPVSSAETRLASLVTADGVAESQRVAGGGDETPDVEAEVVVLGADTVEGVLDNMREALDRVDTRAADNEQRVSSQLRIGAALAGVLLEGDSSQPASSSLVPVRPALHGASPTEITDGLVRYAE